MPRDEYPQSTGLKPSVSCLRLPGQLCLCPERRVLYTPRSGAQGGGLRPRGVLGWVPRNWTLRWRLVLRKGEERDRTWRGESPAGRGVASGPWVVLTGPLAPRPPAIINHLMSGPGSGVTTGGAAAPEWHPVFLEPGDCHWLFADSRPWAGGTGAGAPGCGETRPGFWSLPCRLAHLRGGFQPSD